MERELEGSMIVRGEIEAPIGEPLLLGKPKREFPHLAHGIQIWAHNVPRRRLPFPSCFWKSLRAGLNEQYIEELTSEICWQPTSEICWGAGLRNMLRSWPQKHMHWGADQCQIIRSGGWPNWNVDNILDETLRAFWSNHYSSKCSSLLPGKWCIYRKCSKMLFRR